MRNNLTFIRQIERNQQERKDHLRLVVEKCQTYKQQRVKGKESSVPDCWKFHKPKRSQLTSIIVDDVHKVTTPKTKSCFEIV